MKHTSANVYVNTCPPDKVMIDGANSSFVTTSEGIVLIDTPYLPTHAVRWRDEIAGRGEVRFIVNTEHHRDHITGNYFFPGAVVVSSQVTRGVFGTSIGTIDDVRAKCKERDPGGLPLVENYRLRLPSIVFLERLNLYLGEQCFELMHLPGHTPGEIAVYVPKEKVVFTGDNFTNGWQPGLNNSCPIEWVESLKKIETLDFDVAVPGHGDVGDKKAVRQFRGFIEECIDVMRKAIRRGMSREEAGASITFETKAYPPALHPGRERQYANVVRLYDALSTEPT